MLWLQDERRVKILGKHLPGSLEHSEGDCAVCATRQAACEGSGQTFTIHFSFRAFRVSVVRRGRFSSFSDSRRQLSPLLSVLGDAS